MTAADRTQVPERLRSEHAVGLPPTHGGSRQNLITEHDPPGFSPKSLAVLAELQADYTQDIVIQAARRARNNEADVVSAADVEFAARRIRQGGARRAWFEAVGGIGAGAGAGTFLQLAVEQNPSILGLSLAAITAVVGFVLTAAGLAARR